MTEQTRTFVTLAVVALSLSCAAPEDPGRPNILFIAVDDLRPELGCYGADHVVSPNIDRLAAEGLVFDRAYCQSAVCNPSRASLMTGKRPDTLKVWDLSTDMRTVNPEVVTLGQHLRNHGWKLGEHNSWCKMTNLEIDARVPLIFKAPGKTREGSRTTALVEFVDIYPTLCDLTGVPAPDDLEGTSFTPLIGDPSNPWKKAAFTQFLREGAWIAPDGVEYMGYSVRTDRFRYTEWVEWQTGDLKATELYDHEVDPWETANVSADKDYAGSLQEMAGILAAGWTAAGPETR